MTITKRPSKTQIAAILLEKNLISVAQLDQAIKIQSNSDKKIGQILVELGFVDEIKLLELLSEQLHIPFIDLKNFAVNPETIKKLPEFYARHFRAIILKYTDDEILVGMVDPQNLIAKDEIERALKHKIKPALIREEDLLFILDNFYRRAEEITHFAETLSAEITPAAQQNNLLMESADFATEDLPVVNLLRSIFEDAAQVNASDIHIEPGESVLRIRIRIDGVLQEQVLPEKGIAEALAQRIKLAAGLNIAEKRLPQDGRFSLTVLQKKFDIRVSTLPTQYGESIVMRLLNQSADLLHLHQIGMPADILHYYKQLLSTSYGLLLIVGPTGSGKTTTLYASLNELNKPEDKIISVEDPIEYRLSRINQVQVNPKIDLTFASILRSILRQDPDIIMIGEIRDKETMDIGLRAAMTGHFVLATLHTNDTISTVARLLEMGAEGYLLASVLRAIVAQRLVRRICQKCITDDPLTDSEKAWLAALNTNIDFATITFKKGSGCSYCRQTGYAGRAGVYELLPINAGIIDALRLNDMSAFDKAAKQEPLYQTLQITGLNLAIKGITTVYEVIKMAGEV